MPLGRKLAALPSAASKAAGATSAEPPLRLHSDAGRLLALRLNAGGPSVVPPLLLLLAARLWPRASAGRSAPLPLRWTLRPLPPPPLLLRPLRVLLLPLRTLSLPRRPISSHGSPVLAPATP